MTEYLEIDIYSNSESGLTKNRIAVPCERGNITEEMIIENDIIVLKFVTRDGDTRPQFQPKNETRQLAFGGNFVWSCDSRFRNQYGSNPVPLHDYLM